MSAEGPEVGTCRTITVSVRAPSVPSTGRPPASPRTSEPASRYVVPGVVSGVPESAATCWMRPFAQISRPTGQAMASASSRSSAMPASRSRRRRAPGRASGGRVTGGRVPCGRVPESWPGTWAGGRELRAVPDGGTGVRPPVPRAVGAPAGWGGAGGRAGGTCAGLPVGWAGRRGAPTTTGGEPAADGRGR